MLILNKSNIKLLLYTRWFIFAGKKVLGIPTLIVEEFIILALLLLFLSLQCLSLQGVQNIAQILISNYSFFQFGAVNARKEYVLGQ
jgi:hypothetical protein